MTKQCTKCKNAKPITEFGKDRKRADGLNSHCRDCKRVADKRYYEANKSKVLSKNEAWRVTNQERINANQRRRYRPGESTARNRRWRSENKPRYNALMRSWRSRNTEKVAATNRVRDPQQRIEHNARRRARKKKVHTEPISRKTVHARDAGSCYLCGAPVAFEDMHLDHKMPLSRGGSHTYRNVGCTCASCNLRKKDKTPTEFRGIVTAETA